MAYNGWTNRETWLVNLWFGDSIDEDSPMTAEGLEDYVKEIIGFENLDGFVRDMLDIAAINWDELVADLWPEKDEDEEDDEDED
jgi:hypothetical protein